jgi:hypothetical protein
VFVEVTISWVDKQTKDFDITDHKQTATTCWNQQFSKE